ncbi:uncharacterized protein LOC111694426 [Trichogramma pretiosum]|uniref:uncharacterized protein LOC111694426 n=1 Tax=Trichogramma pretiosum TaxID=7493 RepID=UPI000C71A5D5|nr:uncharacterized protein LOC111694426 [Trichogramma pretiosum]
MASHTLKGPELNYFTTELELLALTSALEKFRSYVYGKPIEVRTEHQALTFLRTSRFLSQRLLRWSLMIQDYDLTIKLIPGKMNVLADVLGRPIGKADNAQDEAHIYAMLARQPQKSIVKELKNTCEFQADDLHLKQKSREDPGKSKAENFGKSEQSEKSDCPRQDLNPRLLENFYLVPCIARFDATDEYNSNASANMRDQQFHVKNIRKVRKLLRDNDYPSAFINRHVFKRMWTLKHFKPDSHTTRPNPICKAILKLPHINHFRSSKVEKMMK